MDNLTKKKSKTQKEINDTATNAAIEIQKRLAEVGIDVGVEHADSEDGEYTQVKQKFPERFKKLHETLNK